MSRRCRECGIGILNETRPDSYQYKISGLDDIYLNGGVVETVCSNCGARSTRIKNLPSLHKTIASSLALVKRRLNGSELRFLREHIGYSAEDFSKIVEYNTAYIRKIENGTQVPKAPYEVMLRLATLKGVKGPSYELTDLAPKGHGSYRLEFVNRDKTWEQKTAA